jgi:hypothetical protein
VPVERALMAARLHRISTCHRAQPRKTDLTELHREKDKAQPRTHERVLTGFERECHPEVSVIRVLPAKSHHALWLAAVSGTHHPSGHRLSSHLHSRPLGVYEVPVCIHHPGTQVESVATARLQELAGSAGERASITGPGAR